MPKTRTKLSRPHWEGSTKNRDLWPGPTPFRFWMALQDNWDQNQSDLWDLILRMLRVTESQWIMDFRCWTWPEVAILGADQKERSLFRREWMADRQLVSVLMLIPRRFPLVKYSHAWDLHKHKKIKEDISFSTLVPVAAVTIILLHKTLVMLIAQVGTGIAEEYFREELVLSLPVPNQAIKPELSK